MSQSTNTEYTESCDDDENEDERGSQGCQAVSAGASSKGLGLVPSAGSGSHAGQPDVPKDDSDRLTNRQAKTDRIAAFVMDSQACSESFARKARQGCDFESPVHQ
jgi:hypothetical protein